eukprot:736472-Pelagomonas_calceolata.AAC.1
MGCFHGAVWLFAVVATQLRAWTEVHCTRAFSALHTLRCKTTKVNRLIVVSRAPCCFLSWKHGIYLDHESLHATADKDGAGSARHWFVASMQPLRKAEM